MKRSTVELLVIVSIIYYGTFFLVRSAFPAGENVPLFLLIGPLALLVAVLTSDLANRAVVPSRGLARTRPERRFSREVQLLTREIDVGRNASTNYFDGVLLSRLRDLLADKVALETGLEKTRVQEVLKNPVLGPGLLKNDGLYRLLYSRGPAKGSERVRLLQEAVAGIEAWKP